MWNVKTKQIPVTMETNGTISKSFRQYLSNITRKHENQGTTQNSHTGHCTYTAESDNCKRTQHSTREISLHVAYTVTTQ
jgi:hypothetical protein